MNLLQVYRMELYKMGKRKSSRMLLIPCLLVILISLGIGSGNVTVTRAGASTQTLVSCMDYFISVWNILSGFGIIGILVILTASLQFSGEIERGQIKTSLLRVGKRSQVILAKLFVMTTVVIIMSLVLTVTIIGCYYWIIIPADMGTGTFAISIDGLTNYRVFAAVLCWAANYILLSAAAFLAGTYFGPFVTFFIVLILMYTESYFVTMGSFKLLRYLPEGFVNYLMTGGSIKITDVILIAACTLGITGVMIFITMNIFKRQDIR